LPGWHYKPKPQIVTRAALVFWPLMYEQRPNEAKRGEVSQVIALPASPQWPAEGIKDCAIGIWKICWLNAVKLALHNAYFFRGATTPSNLIRQSVLNRPRTQIICRR
jgi:hypothetical protein